MGEKTVDEQRHEFVTARMNRPEIVQRWPDFAVRRKELSRMFEQRRRDGEAEPAETDLEAAIAAVQAKFEEAGLDLELINALAATYRELPEDERNEMTSDPKALKAELKRLNESRKEAGVEPVKPEELDAAILLTLALSGDTPPEAGGE